MSNDNKRQDSYDHDDDEEPKQIPYRRDRTPSIVVQSLGLSFKKDSNITGSIELAADDEDNTSPQDSSEASDPKSSTSGIADSDGNVLAGIEESGGSSASAKGSLSSLHNNNNNNNSSNSPINAQSSPIHRASRPSPLHLASTNRRLSLNIGSTAPRRQSLTVDGLSSASFINPALKESSYPSGNATGSLRNKVALKPGHSLMGWIKLASAAKDLAGTGGKPIEVTPEMLALHDREDDCWVALKGNVYNVTKYLHYHPGGVEELMRGAGRDATKLFNEVHRWVNYESILAKCLVGPYKLDSPSAPAGRATFQTITDETNNRPNQTTTTGQTIQPANRPQHRQDPTVAHRPNRRQSIALTVPSPNKYQSLLLNNNSSTNLNTIQQPPTYVIMQDKSCIKIKIQDLTTLNWIRARHLICDLNDKFEVHISVILSSDWLYRIHLRLDQQVERQLKTDLLTSSTTNSNNNTASSHQTSTATTPTTTSSDENTNHNNHNNSNNKTITIQLNKKEQSIWNRIGTSMNLNDSLCEMTLADKFFRPCTLMSKKQITHDTYLFEFKLNQTLMYVPIGWHCLLREYNSETVTNATDSNNAERYYEDTRIYKNYTPVLPSVLDNNGQTDESGFMERLYFIVKIYPDGVLTSKLHQLKLGDKIDISDYQCVDFDIEQLTRCGSGLKNWIILAAGTGITPFCRIISYLLSQANVDLIESVTLVFFNKTQNDLILKDQFDELMRSNFKFKIEHVLSNEPERSKWVGKRGRISKDLLAEFVDSKSPDELQILACGPRAFTQLTKSISNELNLSERLYVFHG